MCLIVRHDTIGTGLQKARNPDNVIVELEAAQGWWPDKHHLSTR